VGDATILADYVLTTTTNIGEEEAVGGWGWYRSKERWWVPIGPT